MWTHMPAQLGLCHECCGTLTAVACVTSQFDDTSCPVPEALGALACGTLGTNILLELP